MSREKYQWPLRLFCAWAASVIERKGWVPRKTGNSQTMNLEPTMDVVLGLIIPPPAGYPEELFKSWKNRQIKFLPTNEHFGEADRAIAWAASLGEKVCRKNTYYRNLRNLAAGELLVTPKVAGLAASLVDAHHKATAAKVG